MCGIAAILDLAGAGAGARPGDIERMVAAIRHRGPDGEGVWRDRELALGAVRLAILDLSGAGHQPMVLPAAGIALSYNGELYNHRELRDELTRLGHAFRSTSDTEVVLRAWAEWGEGCLTRFNGMFALAVWDSRARELTVARDRFGIKPLYWARHGGRLLVASEVKALLAAGVTARVDEEALLEYFTFQNVLGARTLFAGVELLPAGCLLRARCGARRGGAVEVERWWDLELAPDPGPAPREWGEELRGAFTGAVDRHLVADVEVGSYLSGGIDSASIVALASGGVTGLKTVTAGFDMTSVEGLEIVFDERDEARFVAEAFGTDHHELVLRAGDMARVLPRLVWDLEDPRLGMSYQNHHVASRASELVKVVLSGGGGDELFGGYPWRYDLIAALDDRPAFDAAYYGYWSRLVGDGAREAFFHPGVLAGLDPGAAWQAYRRVIAPADGLDPVSRALYFEAKTFLHGLLVIEDKVSMAHGLESRLPFLDNEVVEVARRLPPHLKHAGPGGKPLLREALVGILPDAVLARPKQGFSPPDQSWYRGPTMDYLRAVLLDERTLERGWFRPETVRAMLDEHLSGRQNHRLLIWSLLSFEWWNRLFVDGDSMTGGTGRPPLAEAASTVPART